LQAAEAGEKGRGMWPHERPQGATRFLLEHGRVLVAMNDFEPAEAELLEAWAMLQDASVEIRNPDWFERISRSVAESLAELYEAWHADEPEPGLAPKAALWRARLEAISDVTDGG
jgi:hypothetical protein